MNDYLWSTEKGHANNTETMADYLENHLPSNLVFMFQDGSYAEVYEENSGRLWGVHAGGNGDFFNHKVRFEFLSILPHQTQPNEQQNL